MAGSGLEKINHDLPDVTNVKSKLDDKNPAYKPPTSTKRIEVRKLQWKAESKIENNNLDYKKKALQASMENGIDKAQKVAILNIWFLGHIKLDLFAAGEL